MLEGLFRRQGKNSIPSGVVLQEDINLQKDAVTIENLRAPIEHIVEELSEEFENGTYGLLIGDDASGRIPTIILARILQKIAERRGADAPMVRFLAGSTLLYLKPEKQQEDKRQGLSEQIHKMKDTAIRSGHEIGKVLIVTDFVSTGETVETFLTALRENGLEADIASMGTWEEKMVQRMVSTRLIAGRSGAPQITNASKELTGVFKSNADVFAKPFSTADDERARHGRQLAKQMAEEVFNEYESRRNA